MDDGAWREPGRHAGSGPILSWGIGWKALGDNGFSLLNG